jgi:hypothetical protein
MYKSASGTFVLAAAAEENSTGVDAGDRLR